VICKLLTKGSCGKHYIETCGQRIIILDSPHFVTYCDGSFCVLGWITPTVPQPCDSGVGELGLT